MKAYPDILVSPDVPDMLFFVLFLREHHNLYAVARL